MHQGYTVSAQIENLTMQFSKLISAAQDEFIRNKKDVKSIRNHIKGLPYRLRKDTTSSTHIQNIMRNEIDSLFVYLTGTILNFIDYGLLEYIVGQLGSDELKRMMDDYISELSRFERKITVSEFKDHWDGRREIPASYCELTARINANPNHYTLDRLNTLRKKLCKQFVPPLPEFSILHCKFDDTGKVVIEWCIAQDLVPAIFKGSNDPKNLSFFAENGIETLHVRGIAVYRASEVSSISTSSQNDGGK